MPGGLKGTIVLVDLPNLPLIAGIFDLAKIYEYDPRDTIHFSTPYRRQWINGVLAAVADIYKGLAAERQATSDSLVAILPGMGSENVVINTHTDGENAFEENGTSACVALARYYAAKPITQRPRTLVFSCVTGHMVAGLPQAQGFVDAHPDLIAHCVASMTIEHLGAKEWADSPIYGYRPTGLPEMSAIFCTSKKPSSGSLITVRCRSTDSMAELAWCVQVLGKLDGMSAQAIRG